MSLCVRTISNKLTPFVGTRKTVTRLVRRLPKDIKASAFLEQFLGSSAIVRNDGIESNDASSNLLVLKPLKTTSDNIVAWNYKLRTEGNWIIGRNEKECIDDVNRINISNDVTQNKCSMLYSTSEKKTDAKLENGSSPESEEKPDNAHEKPTLEQLENVQKVLRTDLPAFFIKSIDYSIYHPFIVFENNLKGTVTKGIYDYVKQMALLRIIGHLKFAYVKFDVLKITVHPEDSTIKVRWRIRGITGTKVLFNFWKFKAWKLQEAIDQLESWHDGFSTFYVDGNGKVTRHVADKMMPDQDTEVSTKEKGGMAAKLALFVGLFAPREFLTDIIPLTSVDSEEDLDCPESNDCPVDKLK